MSIASELQRSLDSYSISVDHRCGDGEVVTRTDISRAIADWIRIEFDSHNIASHDVFWVASSILIVQVVTTDDRQQHELSAAFPKMSLGDPEPVTDPVSDYDRAMRGL